MQELSTASVLLADSQTADCALKANILLVDDSPTKLLALESALASLGQNLLTACSAAEALRYLLAQDCAVIVLDVNMPGMNGFELAGAGRRAVGGLLKPVPPAANEAGGLEAALQLARERICAYPGWPVGHIYRPAPDNSGLWASSPFWHPAPPARFVAFQQATQA